MKIGAVSAELYEQQSGTEKISRVTIATSSTMVLDSSGTSAVSAAWRWEMRSAIVARVRDRNMMEVADDLGHRFWRFLPYDRQSGSRSVNDHKRVSSDLSQHHQLSTTVPLTVCLPSGMQCRSSVFVSLPSLPGRERGPTPPRIA